MLTRRLVCLTAIVAAFTAPQALAVPFNFSTGAVTNFMASASRPDATGKIEIESADDFVLGTRTRIDSAIFTGLLTGGATISDISGINVEIYRVFPLDSNTTRTPNVPTRVNSPSDVAFAERNGVSFTGATLNASFTALNSVQAGGIHPLPNQTTGGNGAVTGQEVQFQVTFSSPFDLPPDHYFFVPQVDVDGGEFLWLSAERPIVTGTPFAPDLQAWIRDGDLDPDWLRIGTDIVGGATPPTFNLAFSLAGETVDAAVSEPSALALLATLGMILGSPVARRGKRN